MTGCLAVWRKELIIYFATPIFYLTGFFFLLSGGIFLSIPTLLYYTVLSFQAGQNPYLASMLTPLQMVYRPFFGNLAVIFLFIVPLFTMRLFAEEKRSGTIELLFTFPLTDWGVILGQIPGRPGPVCPAAGHYPALQHCFRRGHVSWIGKPLP